MSRGPAIGEHPEPGSPYAFAPPWVSCGDTLVFLCSTTDCSASHHVFQCTRARHTEGVHVAVGRQGVAGVWHDVGPFVVRELDSWVDDEYRNVGATL